MKYFNLITGDLFSLPDDMKDVVDKYCLQLNKFPNANCNKCFGRFYTSYNKTKKIYNICSRCTSKYVTYNLEDIKIETLKQTNEMIFN